MGFEVKCVPVLDKMPCCCCSCDLKLATCILGWLGMIGGVLSLLRSAVSLAVIYISDFMLPPSIQVLMISTVVSSAIGVLLTGLLLYGAHTEKPGFMVPSLILQMIAIVMVVVAVIYASTILFPLSLISGFVFLLLGILTVVLSTFFWVVIYSYYRKLEEGQYPIPAATLDHDGKQVTVHIGHTQTYSGLEARE